MRDIIKSVASLSGVPHLLAGTYDLLPFLDLSGQLARRAVIVHLPRCSNVVQEDADLFASVVRAFQRHLPLAEEPDLLGQVEYLSQHPIGCVGVLKDWLGRALNVASDEDAPTMTKAHLQKRALTAKQCRMMLADAQKGEKYFADDDAELARLQAEPGMSSTTPATSSPPSPDDANGNVSTRKHRPTVEKPCLASLLLRGRRALRTSALVRAHPRPHKPRPCRSRDGPPRLWRPGGRPGRADPRQPIFRDRLFPCRNNPAKGQDLHITGPDNHSLKIRQVAEGDKVTVFYYIRDGQQTVGRIVVLRHGKTAAK